MTSITPFLWFDGRAEEATNLYVSIFRNAKLVGINRAGPNGPVISTTFELEGQRFHALNGGPRYRFSPAISFMVIRETQPEIDELWGQLTEGGQEQPCGWLTDRFGLSWQVIPSVLGPLLGDPKHGQEVLKEMLTMKKLDIARLKRAAGQA